MKKVIISLVLAVLFVFFSPVAKADTLSQQDLKAKLALINQQMQTLQSEIDVLNKLINPTPITSVSPTTSLAPDDPSNRYNTATGLLNPKYTGYVQSSVLPSKTGYTTLPSGAVLDKNGNVVTPATGSTTYAPPTYHDTVVNDLVPYSIKLNIPYPYYNGTGYILLSASNSYTGSKLSKSYGIDDCAVYVGSCGILATLVNKEGDSSNLINFQNSNLTVADNIEPSFSNGASIGEHAWNSIPSLTYTPNIVGQHILTFTYGTISKSVTVNVVCKLP